MSEGTAKRRWFRFGLRTMFMVITLVAAASYWLAANLRWVRDRDELLNGPNISNLWATTDYGPGLIWLLRPISNPETEDRPFNATWGWRRVWINFDPREGSRGSDARNELERLSALFPEAEDIMVCDYTDEGREYRETRGPGPFPKP